jgi:peptidoglycan/xylan/chitin deacetylase (PgdA/CDA1 family)
MPTARAILWIATIGAFAIVVRTFWLGPLPVVVPLAFGCLYVAMLFLGIFFPRWGMYADVVEAAEPGRKVVALTFDDGPGLESTPQALALLERFDAKATFFVIARKAELHPELMRAIVEQGHELGLHGYSHSRLTAFRSQAFIEADLERAQRVIKDFVPGKLRWFRPPVGHVTPRIANVAKKLGLTIVCWTVRGLDGLPGVEPSRVARRVREGLEDGGIVALHDAHELVDGIPAGVATLEGILREIEAQGWRAVTLTELLDGTQVNTRERSALHNQCTTIGSESSISADSRQ